MIQGMGALHCIQLHIKYNSQNVKIPTANTMIKNGQQNKQKWEKISKIVNIDLNFKNQSLCLYDGPEIGKIKGALFEKVRHHIAINYNILATMVVEMDFL